MKKPLFLILASLLILSTLILNVNAVTYEYEDFLADYTEWDANNKITISQHQINYVNFEEGEEGWVYRDFGTDYFGSSFNYSFAWKIELNGAIIPVMGVAEEPKTYFSLQDYGIAIAVWDRPDPWKRIGIWERDFGTDYYSTYYDYNGSEAYVYKYFRFFKDGTDAWLEIYSDSMFSSLITNLTITLQNNRSYRYMMPLWSYGGAGAMYSNGILRLLMPRADVYKVNLNIYGGDEVYGGGSKPIVIGGSHYGIQTAWFLGGEYSLAFDIGTHSFLNWTGSANVTVADSTNETTTLTITNYGNLTLYMSISTGEAMFLWFMNRTMLWLGLIGIFICMVCPVVAFQKIRRDDLEGGFMWFLGVFILGIPFIVAWLWG